MRAHGKNFTSATKEVDPEKLYEPREALELIKKIAFAKFDETVEVHVRTGLDPRHQEQQVRGTAVLPHGTGRTQRVLVFAQADKAREAEEAGADYVGGEDLAKKIEGGWLEFDVAIAAQDMMGLVGRLGKVLGPRGLMPNPRTGTVTMDVGRVVREVKGGRIEFRLDKTGVLHAPVGKVSFEVDKLAENLGAFVDAVTRAKPSGSKGQYLRSITVKSTMGPGLKLDIANAHALAAA